jgi:hypothetical protein
MPLRPGTAEKKPADDDDGVGGTDDHSSVPEGTLPRQQRDGGDDQRDLNEDLAQVVAVRTPPGLLRIGFQLFGIGGQLVLLGAIALRLLSVALPLLAGLLARLGGQNRCQIQ